MYITTSVMQKWNSAFVNFAICTYVDLVWKYPPCRMYVKLQALGYNKLLEEVTPAAMNQGLCAVLSEQNLLLIWSPLGQQLHVIALR